MTSLDLWPGAAEDGIRTAANDNEALGLPPTPLLKQLLGQLAVEVGQGFPAEDPGTGQDVPGEG